MRLLHDPRFLSETIAAIYDCAVDPARWQVVIPQLAGLIGARRAALGVATISGAMPVVAALHGYDGVDNMATYAPLNPLLPLSLVAVPDKALVASRAIGLPALRATRFYREYLRPLGDLDAVGFLITREADALGHWALITQDDRPPVSDEEIAGLELIAPHVRRAAEISRVLGVQQIESATYRAVLDRLDSAVLILDGRRRLSHVNPRGEAALSEGRVLRLRDGRLVGATDEAEATLRRAIDSALAGAAGAEATVKGTDGAESLLFAVTLEARGSAPRPGRPIRAAHPPLAARAHAQPRRHRRARLRPDPGPGPGADLPGAGPCARRDRRHPRHLHPNGAHAPRGPVRQDGNVAAGRARRAHAFLRIAAPPGRARTARLTVPPRLRQMTDAGDCQALPC